MIVFPVGKYRKPHAKAKGSTAPPGPAVLTLVAASYSEAELVRLTFDRAIDFSDIDLSSITVRDGQMDGHLFVGIEASAVGANGVDIILQAVEPFTDDYVARYATAENGIVAAVDGSEWAGVHELVLPWP